MNIRLGMGKQEMENTINEEMFHFAKYLETKAGKPVNLAVTIRFQTNNTTVSVFDIEAFPN